MYVALMTILSIFDFKTHKINYKPKPFGGEKESRLIGGKIYRS